MKFIKEHIGPIYIALMSVAIAIYLVCADEVGEVCAMLGHLDGRFMAGALGCILLYLFLRVLTLRIYLAHRGHRLSWRDAVGITGTGQFYSAITPSASGGQPMQVLRLRQKGVPVGMGTACISAKFMGFQTGFVSLGLVLALTHLRYLNAQLYGWRWLVALGYVTNMTLVLAVLLTIPKLGIVDRLAGALIRLGHRLHLVRDPGNALKRFDHMIEEYREALLALWKQPLDALVIYLLSLCQVVCYMSVVICVYHAFRLSGTDAVTLLTVQLQLFVAAAFIPLPGSAGAQESGFFFFFHGIFPEAQMTAAILIWRFFTYYLLLLLGFVMMALGGMRKKRGDAAA